MNQQQPLPVKKGREIVLDITAAAFGGKGLGRINDYAVFVPNTAPGDRVRVRITRKRKKYAEGILLEVLNVSQHRITPQCRHATVCGGCSWQHISYDQELAYKTGHVTDHFQRIGGFHNPPVEPVTGSPDLFHYRNKMEYTFGDRRWLTDEEIRSGKPVPEKDFALGLHIPGRYDRILNLEECHLQDPVSFRILDTVRKYALQKNLKPYNPHKHQGYLRNLVIRNAEHTGELMVNLVTNSDDKTKIEPVAEHLLDKFPDITTIINTINDTRSPSSVGRYRNIIHGPGYIHEALGNYRFKIDPVTFFQPNTRQAEQLYRIVSDTLAGGRYGNIYDLYCGIGSLTLYVSPHADKLVGIELHEEAVKKARENASENNLSHVFFEEGDMKDVFNNNLTDRFGKPDAIVADPPRAGMHGKVIAQIKEYAPEKVIYVSCNSATQARDVALLADKYELKKIHPVDMFPRTYHIESVAVLDLK